MPTETINIIVTDRGGARTVSRSITGIGTAADRANRKTGKLVGTLRDVATVSRDIRNLFLILGAAKTFSFVRGASDEFKRINNTLRGFEVGEKNLDNIRKQIKAVANESRVGAKETTVFFGRLKKATKDLGLSDRQVLELTGTAQKALRLGGASATEATQAVRQLTQAFNKGKLDGDEFRSVLENAPVLAELLSEKLGVTKSVLREMAEEGKITTEILVGALQNGADKIDTLFGTLEQTSDDAFTVLRNNVVEYIGELDRATGTSRSFIGLVNQLADGFGNNLANALTLAGGALAIFFLNVKNIKILFGVAPFFALVNTFSLLNGEIKSMTGGSRNLASVFGDVAVLMRQLVTATAEWLRILLKAAEVDFPNLEEALNAMSVGGGFLGSELGEVLGYETDTRIMKRARAIARKNLLASQLVADTKGLPADLDFEKLNQLMKSRSGPFEDKRPVLGSRFFPNAFKSDPPLINEFQALGKKLLAAAIEEARTEIVDQIRIRDPASGGSAARAGQNEIQRGQLEESRRLEQATQLESKLLSVQSILDKSGDAQNELASEAAKIQGEIVSRVLDAVNGPNSITKLTTDQLKELNSEVETVLSKLEKASGDEAIGKATQDVIRAELKSFEELKTKITESRSLREEEKTAAVQQIDAVAKQANDLLVAATAQTAQIMKNVYTEVLGDIQGLAGSFRIDLSGVGVLSPSASDQIGAGSEELTTDLSAVNAELRTLQEQISELGNRSVGSFAAASNAARGFGNTTNNVGNQINNNFGQVFSSLENALVGFVQTGKLDFQSLINSMLADLARLLIRMLIIQPLMGFFGGLFGFGGGGLVGGFSSGGFVGGFSGGGPISSGGFNIPSFGGGCPGGVCDLPSFATGSGVIPGFGGSRSDRFLAAVSPGEFVVNAQDTRRNLPDLMRMNNGGAVVSEGHSGGTNVMTTNITVNVQSTGQDAGADGAKIARAIEAQMDKKLNEYTRRQMKSGGAFKQREA